MGLEKLYKFNNGTGNYLLNYNGSILGQYSGGTPPGPVIPTDYIAYYKFDNSLTDETGNYHASMSGAGTGTYYEAGKVDDCIYWNGNATTPTLHLVTGIPMLKTNIISYVCWFKAPAAHSNIRYISGFQNSATTGRYLPLGVSKNENAGKLQLHTYNGSDYTAAETVNTYNDDQWHFVYAAYDPENQAQYLNVDNGTEIITHDISSAFSGLSTSGGVFVISQESAAYRNIEGNRMFFDDFKIFDRLLTTEEIGALYTASGGV